MGNHSVHLESVKTLINPPGFLTRCAVFMSTVPVWIAWMLIFTVLSFLREPQAPSPADLAAVPPHPEHRDRRRSCRGALSLPPQVRVSGQRPPGGKEPVCRLLPSFSSVLSAASVPLSTGRFERTMT